MLYVKAGNRDAMKYFKETLFIYMTVTSIWASPGHAQNISFNESALVNATISANKKCATFGPAISVTTPNGKLSIWGGSTSYPELHKGIAISYIGGTAGNPAPGTPSKAQYNITFSQPVRSVRFRIAGFTNIYPPGEKLTRIKSNGGGGHLSVSSPDNTLLFNRSRGEITSNARAGIGTIIFEGKAFTQLSFQHTQNPKNIGFTLYEVSAVPVGC